MTEPKKSGNFFWTCSKRSRKSANRTFPLTLASFPARKVNPASAVWEFPSEFWLFGIRPLFRAMNPEDSRIPARMVYSWEGNMYTRRSNGQASADSIAVREWQCEYIDVRAQAPSIQNRTKLLALQPGYLDLGR